MVRNILKYKSKQPNMQMVWNRMRGRLSKALEIESERLLVTVRIH